MKLGKKLLSCILAVIMIVSSMSVCFSVIAAADVSSVTGAIEMYYDDLMESIKSGDTKRVPNVKGGQVMTVAVDTYTSAWYNVTRAWYEYAIGKGRGKTYTAIYNDLLTAAKARVAEGSPIAENDYKAVLDYYNCTYGGPMTVYVKPGYDILAWDTADAMETDRNYHDATFKVTYDGGVTGGTLTDDPDIAGIQNNVTMLKNSILDCQEKFEGWFKLDLDNMSDDELLALVDGEGSCGTTLSQFGEAVSICSSGIFLTEDTAEVKAQKIWDHYIKPATGYTYAQAQEWINGRLMTALYKAYANLFVKDFDALMNFDLSDKTVTADAIREHYNAVMIRIEELNNMVSPTDSTKNIAAEIKAKLPDGYRATVKNYVSQVEVAAAQRYAIGPYASGEEAYADQLTDLIAANVPTYDHDDADAATAWPGSEDEAKAKEFLSKATALIGKIDSDILSFVPFSDSRFTAETGGVDKALSELRRQNISAERYNQLLDKIKTVSLDVNGSSYYQIKAKMDGLMKSTILDGRKTNDLTDYYGTFSALVASAQKLRNSTDESDKEIFNEVFPSKTDADGNVIDGLKEYEDYLITIKERVARRLYEQLKLVEKYAGEATTSQTGATKRAAYNNYEAIIDAYGAIEMDETAFRNFNQNAITKFTLKDGKTEVQVSELINLFPTIKDYYNQAVNFRSGIKAALSAANSSSATADKDILNALFGGSFGNYKWVSAMNKLDYRDIQNFVDSIGLTAYKNGVSYSQLGTLMDNAVKDFDTILVSNDIGTLLEGFLSKQDETGTMTSFLGTWKYNYTVAGVTYKKGTAIKNLKEFLISTIINLLYSGKVQTLAMSTIMPMLGGALTNMEGSVMGIKYSDALPAAARSAIPSMPHHFYWNSAYDRAGGDANSDTQWYKWFDGSILGSDHNYNSVIKKISEASYHKGTYAKSYWTDVNWDTFDSEAAWHIQDASGFYNSMAAAFCGLAVPLATLLTQDQNKLTAEIGVLNITIPIDNTGSSLYDRLFVPLYELLGIPQRSGNNHGYHSKDDIRNACSVTKGKYGAVSSLTNNGVTLWEYLLEPITYWLDNTLFVKPVETILGILPNLLAVLEYNQLVPKLKNIKIKIKATVLATFDITELNLWDMAIKGLLEGYGLTDSTLASGASGILNVLIKATSTTSAPNNDNKKEYLMGVTKDSQGNKVVGTEAKDAAFYQNNGTGTKYYFRNIGLLTQMLYNSFGDGLIEWMWSNSKGEKQNVGNNQTKSVPLTIPVNRFMASNKSNSIGTYSFAGFDGTLNGYHVNSDPGDTLLTLFRWLLDDGTIYRFAGLINGMMEADPETGKTLFDSLLPILDGQADTLLGVLVCLLNDYNVDFTGYTDTVMNNYKNFVNKNGEELLGSKKADDTWPTKFVTGYYLDQVLKDNGGIDSNPTGIAKADAAVANADTVVTSLIPLLMNLLAPMLQETFPDAIEKYNEGKLNTIEDIVLEIVVSNEFINWFMTLLVGDHEYKPKTDSDGNVIKGEDGKPILSDEIDTGLLGGLLGDATGTLAKVLDILAKLDIDVTPNGFYKIAKSGSFANSQLATWFEKCLAKVKAEDNTKTMAT
ncbi:MAG: hypothetical protein Q4D20_03375, partial [Clostridia bacterium]|nr:hypothetical protein [Clostridia bacterium]